MESKDIKPLFRTQVQLEEHQLAWLKHMAKKHSASQAAVLRAVLNVAMRDYELRAKEIMQDEEVG